MIEVKNLLFQPLTLRREEPAGGLYLGPREKATLRGKEISEEMRLAEARGLISIRQLPAPEPATKTDPEAAKAKKEK